MLCPRCGTYVAAEDVVCPGCGAAVEHSQPEEGVRAIRQGKRGRETMAAASSTARHARASDRGASRTPVQPIRQAPAEDIPVYGDTGRLGLDGQTAEGGYARYRPRPERDTAPLPKARQPHGPKLHQVKRRMVNWTHVAIAMVCVVIMAMVGIYFYMTRTAGGQRIMARLGYEATAQALWQVGEEAMDSGNITTAIENFEAARLKDGEENVNVDGLLLLGSAYEAAGRVEDAEALYTELYTTIVPTRAEPYRNVIRIMLAQDRGPEAADLMLLAYEKTGQVTFRQQRTELLPAEPTVDLVAGLYNINKTLTLASPQGYDVYYTFNSDAVLPDEGTLYTEPIYLEEGIFNLRAVAVSGDLVSDELNGSYKIIMPSPQAPRATLAPNTYQKRQRVRLKPGEENEKDTDITIYYTIDGSNPDADSPIFTGDAIELPTGYVTLRAIAVNGYGKVSNTLEILYKIEARPWPLSAYSIEDTIAGLTLYVTTRDKFQEEYGAGTGKEEITVEGFTSPCEKYTYDWGYAVMAPKKNDWVLIELYCTTTRFAGPRSTAVGNTEETIVGKFRDLGQVESPSGNRGLYAKDSDVGKIYKQPDGSKIIRYRTTTADSHVWQLDYIMSSGDSCTAIHWQLEY